MVHTPGWIVLSRKVAELAGLTVIDRLLEQPKRPRTPAAAPAATAVPEAAPPLPGFIREIADTAATRYRVRTSPQAYLFAGFYSDGRVRLATTGGKRYSGIMVDEKAFMADLHDDISFEMRVATHADVDDLMILTMDGGPFAHEQLVCEKLA